MIERLRVRGMVLGGVILGFVLLCSVAVAQSGDRGEDRRSSARDFDPRTPEFRREAAASEARAAEESRRRGSAGAREDRRRSRSTHRGLSAGEARQLAAQKFPSLLGRPAPGEPALEPGERIESYIGDQWARVDHGPGEPDTVLRSFIPLRAQSESGARLPVDFGLQDRGSFLEPFNSPSPVRISKRAGGGARLEASGVGVRPTGATVDGADASVLAGKAFYASIAQDTDFVVEPTPMGLETFWVLRSPAAPELLSLEIDVPAGATVRERAPQPDGALSGAPLPDRFIEVVRDGEVIAAIHPPAAEDAEGHPVEVSMALEGTRAVLRVDHRDKDLASPILVDPLVEDYLSWKDVPGYTDPSSTFNNWGYDQGGCAAAACGSVYGYAGNSYLGKGLYAWGQAGHYFTGGRYSQWIWRAPGDAYIYRADFGWTDHEPANSQLYEGIFSYSRFAWESACVGEPYQPCYYTAPFFQPNAMSYSFHTACQNPCGWGNPGSEAGTPGNAMVFGIQMRSNGTVSGQPLAFMGGAQVALHEYNAPRLSPSARDGGVNPKHFGLPTGWTRSASIRSEVDAYDTGLGMKSLNLTSPTGWGLSGYTDGCNGERAQTYDRPCSREFYTWFNYHTDSLPEGIVPIRATARDIVGNQADVASWQVKIDRSAPSTTISTDFPDGAVLRDRDYTITGTSTDPYSGSQRLAIKLDGVEQKVRTDCPATTAPCQLPWTLDGGDQSLSEGEHTLQVTSLDRVGNPGASTVRRFRVDRTAPSFDFEGTLKPPDTTFVTPTVEGIALDAVDDTSGGRPATGAGFAEFLIDGAQVPGQSFEQTCADPACQLSADFEVDLSTYADGEHEVTALVRDGAGNTAPPQTWTINIERTAPSLLVTGDLKAAAGQTLDAGRTYSVSATALESSPVPKQSGMGTLEFRVDEDGPQTVEQSCEMGGCSLSHTFTYNADDYGSEDHTIRVTATDAAGNQTTDSFVVTNPDPPPLSCDPPPLATPVAPGAAVTPEAARQSFESHLPEAVAPAIAFDLDGRTLRPELQASFTTLAQTFSASGGLIDSTIASEAPGYRPEITSFADDSVICLTPTGLNPLASEPTKPIGGAATVYANSNTATDTVLRSSAAGTSSFTQLRDITAPTEISWNVGMSPGQRLQMLPNGSAAVVEPARADWGTPTEAAEGLPPAPSASERRRAITDTELGLVHASHDLQRAQASVPDDVVALISKPEAQDRNGPLATSLSVSGSTVTMRVQHGLGTAYPVIAGQRVGIADGVYDYEALTAVAETRDYTDAEAEAHEPPALEGDAPTASSTPKQEEGDDQSEEATDAQDPDEADSDANHVDADGRGEQRGMADPTVPVRADMAANMGRLRVGISQSDQTVFASLARPAIAPLRPVAVRAFVPWNFVQLKALVAGGNPPGKTPEARTRATKTVQRWDALVADYRNRFRGIANLRDRPRIDIVFAQNLTRKPPGVEEYRDRTRAFLNAYLREQGDANLGINIDNVMAWNEPDNRSARMGGTPNQLARKPGRAAQLWTAAHSLCKPKDAGVKDLCRYAVAGEFVSSSTGPKVRFRGKELQYHKAYGVWLRQNTRPERRPRVWGFHSSTDMALFMTATNRRTRFSMPTTRRYRNIYISPEYRYKPTRDSGERQPLIWATEVGAPYRLPCSALGDTARGDRCVVDDKNIKQDDVVLQMGMRLQSDAAAFLFKRLAQRFPEVSRLYYFDLHRSRNVDGVTAPDCCPPLDRSLVGSDADNERSAATNTSYKLEEERTGKRTPSTPQQPRLAFCVVRDRSQTKKLSRSSKRVTACP